MMSHGHTGRPEFQVPFLVLSALLLLTGPAAGQDGKSLWKQADPDASKPVVVLPSFSDIAKKLKPSVVSFYVTTEVDLQDVDPMYKLFKDFFKGMPGVPDTYTNKGVGSGVIINEKGYILTNSHVVENVKSIKVVLDSGQTYDGEVVGMDMATDLALVKIKAPILTPAVLADSDSVEIGDWVIAIGNPFGLEATVTVGIVSAIGRHEIGPPQLRYQDLIQTDAPINPGNSGGPLVDLAGNVVGIATAITASGQGIGFAIPINMAKEIMPFLLNEGKVSRSWLGVTVQRLSDLLAQSYGLDSTEGALIVDVHENSPAWTTGLKPGDVILELDSKKITTPDKLSWYASIAGAGKKVTLKIFRDGKTKSVTLNMASMPMAQFGMEAPKKIKISSGTKDKKSSDLTKGLKVESIDKYTAAKIGLQGTGDEVQGVLVINLDESSALADAGLAKGDIVLDVNGKPCLEPSDLFKSLKKAKKGSVIRLYVVSQNKKGYLAFKK
jgi:serine protease Do